MINLYFQCPADVQTSAYLVSHFVMRMLELGSKMTCQDGLVRLSRLLYSCGFCIRLFHLSPRHWSTQLPVTAVSTAWIWVTLGTALWYRYGLLHPLSSWGLTAGFRLDQVLFWFVGCYKRRVVFILRRHGVSSCVFLSSEHTSCRLTPSGLAEALGPLLPFLLLQQKCFLP